MWFLIILEGVVVVALVWFAVRGVRVRVRYDQTRLASERYKTMEFEIKLAELRGVRDLARELEGKKDAT